MSVYDRRNYYQLGSNKAGQPVLDFIGSDWSSFRENLILSTPHTVNQEEENDLPLIAFNIYGDEDLWWILAQINNIVNPLADVTVGMDLKVPTAESVDRELRQLALANDRIDAQQTVTLPRRSA